MSSDEELQKEIAALKSIQEESKGQVQKKKSYTNDRKAMEAKLESFRTSTVWAWKETLSVSTELTGDDMVESVHDDLQREMAFHTAAVAAVAAAQQQSAKQVNEMMNNASKARKKWNEDYLSNNTLRNGETMSGLLNVKPNIFVCNVDEKSIQNGNKYTKDFISKYGEENTLIVSADIENQINELENSEKKNYMDMIGLNETGLNLLIQKGYKILELNTYFTSGPEETRAWTIEKNCIAPKAAGEIHTDFEKGFIKAETVSYEDFITNNGWVNSKTNGKIRLEGKDYIVKDGDILNFRFNT